jgi:hypothetical protein
LRASKLMTLAKPFWFPKTGGSGQSHPPNAVMTLP